MLSVGTTREVWWMPLRDKRGITEQQKGRSTAEAMLRLHFVHISVFATLDTKSTAVGN